VALSRGMQGLAIHIARTVNEALSRKRGKVFSDRYHEHVLRTPSEVRSAIHYVIHNYRKMTEAGRALRSDFIDDHSAAVYLAGLDPNPLPAPRFWLSRGRAVCVPSEGCTTLVETIIRRPTNASTRATSPLAPQVWPWSDRRRSAR
jgi:hypothetical protein